MGDPVTLESILANPEVLKKISRVIAHEQTTNGWGVDLKGKPDLENSPLFLEKQELAKEFLRQIESHFNPFAWFFCSNLARLAVSSSYQTVEVDASKKTLEAIAEGGVLMFSTHPSYFEIGILPVVFNKYLPEMLWEMQRGRARKLRLKDVYIVGGANVSDVAVVENEPTVFVGDKPAVRYAGWEPADSIVRKAIAVRNYAGYRVVSLKNYVVDKFVDPYVNQRVRKGLGWLLRNFGIIYVKRKADLKIKDYDSLILGEVFSAYVQEKLRQGNSVASFFGNGRQKSGEIMPLQFMANEATLTTARHIVTITVTHETLPRREEDDFAKHIREEAEAASAATGKKRRGATFFYALTLPKWLRIVNPFIETYGTVHVVFSEPIPTAEYFRGKVPSKAEYAVLKRDLLALAVSNVTLTPKNAMATAIGVLGNEHLKVSDLEKEVAHFISVARSTNMHVSEKLIGPDSYRQIGRAIDYFVARKALERIDSTEIRIRDPALLTYYANTVAKTLGQRIQQTVH